MFESLKVALGKIRSEHSVLTKKREKLLQRREDLYNLPISKEDFIDSITDGINTHADEYQKRMQQTVDDFNGRGNSLKNANHVATLPFLSPWSGQGQNSITAMALFALLGNEMRTSLSRVIADLDWPKAGPPIVARKKEIAKLDREISKIDAELGELKAVANQSGVQLTGMSSTQKGKKSLPGESAPNQ